MQLSHHLLASRRSTLVRVLLLVLTAASFLLSGVDAFHTGAGQCLVGTASVGPPHMPSTSGDTTLSGNGIEVSVDGTVLDPLTPFTIAAGTDHTLTISATGTTPFKGYLFALSVPSNTSIDLSTALSPQDTTTGQIASACFAPVVGVTHLNNDTKTSVNATFVLDQDAELALDVTVVIINKLPFGGVSQYGYAGYQLVNSASASGGSTSSPTPATGTATGAPVALQTTNAPVAATSPSAPAASPSAPSAGGSPSSGGGEYYPSSMPAPYSPSAPSAGGSPSSGGEEYYPTAAPGVVGGGPSTPAPAPAPTTPSTGGGSSPTAPTPKTSGAATNSLALGCRSLYSVVATGVVTVVVLLSGTTMM